MRKTIALLTLLLTPMLSNADLLFDNLKDIDIHNVIVIDNAMVQILKKKGSNSKRINAAVELFKSVDGLDEYKIYTTQDAYMIDRIHYDMKVEVEDQPLEKRKEFSEDHPHTSVFTKTLYDKNYVTHVLLLKKGSSKTANKPTDTLLVYLTGRIKEKKLAEIIDTIIEDNS